eukprot:scaffold5507_cov103-Cylindrotheca_fusiformis.AAC.3
MVLQTTTTSAGAANAVDGNNNNNGIRVRSSFTATVVKKSKNVQKLGLSFGCKPSDQDSNVYIVYIAKVSGSFGRKTHLVPGLQVLRVNQTTVSTTQDAMNICRNVQVGHIVSVEVLGSLHKAIKKTKSPSSFFSFGKAVEKVGISIKAVPATTMFPPPLSPSNTIVGDSDGDDATTKTTLIIITHVDDHGLFPDLKTGSILHAVNGKVATSFRKTLSWLTSNKALTLIVLDPPPKQINSTKQEEEPQDSPKTREDSLSEDEDEEEKITTTAPSDVAAAAAGAQPHTPAIQNSMTIGKKTLPTTTQIGPNITDDTEQDCKLRVVACVLRPSLNIPLGLSFRRADKDDGVGVVIIHSVASNGIFANTGIQRNQRIVKINGHPCNQAALNKFDLAVDLLQQATGRVTLEVESTGKVVDTTTVRLIFSIQKQKKSLRLGLGLESKLGVMNITHVSPTLEKVLGLKPGLQLRRVNGEACNVHSIKSVQDQMDHAFPMLSLECLQSIKVATKPDEERVRVVACVIRPNAAVELGLTFRQDVSNGCLIVDTVASHGLFANTGIRAQQKIVKINGHEYHRISQLKLDQAVSLLQQSMGRLTVEAESVLSNPREVIQTHIISIEKAKRNFQLGLGLQQIHTPTATLIKISKVSPTLEKVLGLQEGLRLLRINGVPCNANDVSSVHAQMDQAFPMLSLECTIASEPTTPLVVNPQQQQQDEVVQEKGNDDDDDSWLSQEHEMAEQALPVKVTASSKRTAKIVRTVTVHIPKYKLQHQSKASLDNDLGLTLAKHKHLNAIVITDISTDSLLRKRLMVGQVVISINHISCPLTTDSTMKMLRRKAREGPVLRIEAGDVEHVVDADGFGHKQPSSLSATPAKHETNQEEVDQMIKAIQMGMLKATTDEVKEDYNNPMVVSDSMELEDDDDDFDDVEIPAAVKSFEMIGLPPELLPNNNKKTNSASRPVYYDDENPDIISA